MRAYIGTATAVKYHQASVKRALTTSLCYNVIIYGRRVVPTRFFFDDE